MVYPLPQAVLLILGVVRKEFVLLAAVAIFGTTNLALYFSPVQLVVMALVAMLYIPCVSTVAILGKEFGWKAAATISLANIAAAVLIGGLAFQIAFAAIVNPLFLEHVHQKVNYFS